MAGFGRIFSIVGANMNYLNFATSRNIYRNAQLCRMMKNDKLEQLGIPPRPKKPLTPFFRFMQSERSKVAEENPNLKSVELIRIMAKRWAVVDPKEKEALQRAFEVDLLAHSKKIMMYEQSITPEQRRKLNELKDDKSGKMEKLQLKRKFEMLGKPKRPPTAFIQFLIERKFSKEKNKLATEFARNLADEWKTMSPEEKRKYQEEVRKLMERYKAEIAEWEERMVRQGHLDVVRNRGLISMKSPKPE